MSVEESNSALLSQGIQASTAQLINPSLLGEWVNTCSQLTPIGPQLQSSCESQPPSYLSFELRALSSPPSSHFHSRPSRPLYWCVVATIQQRRGGERSSLPLTALAADHARGGAARTSSRIRRPVPVFNYQSGASEPVGGASWWGVGSPARVVLLSDPAICS